MVRSHLEYANSVWFSYIKGDIEIIAKVQKCATKLTISLKHLPYLERLKRFMLPTLKCRRLRGEMIGVFKIVHDFYHFKVAYFFLGGVQGCDEMFWYCFILVWECAMVKIM